MPRFPDHPYWQRIACVLCLALAGCVTVPPAPRQLGAEQQRMALQSLVDFSFSGRVAVASGSMPAVEWRQHGDKALVKLSAPLGVGSLRLEYSPEQLRLATSRGVKLVNAEAELALVRELGFVPPFDALRYWIRGVPAPGAVAAATYDAAGVLQQLEQHDWLIRYQRQVTVNTAAGSLQLPALLVATRDDLRLRLVIDRWRIK